MAPAAACRSALPEAAPPHGLYLMRVWYPEEKEQMLGRCTAAAARTALEVAISSGSTQSADDDEAGDGDGPPISPHTKGAES